MASRHAHNVKVAGSSPASATKHVQRNVNKTKYKTMKQKILEALKQGHKNLGLSEEAFERVATFGETFITSEEQIETFVNGAGAILKAEQSAADKVRAKAAEEKKALEAKLAELEAKLNEGAKGDEEHKPVIPDFESIIGKAVSESVAKAVQPLQDKLTAFETQQSMASALKTAKDAFFGNDYAGKYTQERDDAWERVMEINELSGGKMTAEQMQEKAMGYFNKLVSRKGVDITKPFEGEGDAKAEMDFSDAKKYLQEEGLIPKDI